MATATRKRPENGSAQTRSTSREYTVAKVLADGKLEVLKLRVKARKQEDAMDIVANKLPPQERNVSLVAFLFRSLRKKKYETTQSWQTRSTSEPPLFPESVGKPDGE